LETQDFAATACAIRETHEETGVDPAGIIPIGQLPSLPLAVSNFCVTPVVGWWQRPNEMRTTTEATRVFRVPVGALVNPAFRVTALPTDRSTTSRFGPPAFCVGGTLVWGFLAMVLDRVLERLGWADPWDPRFVVGITDGDATQTVPAGVFVPDHVDTD